MGCHGPRPNSFGETVVLLLGFGKERSKVAALFLFKDCYSFE